MSAPAPTPAQVYADAVWRSERLTPQQRLVALCYANHARGDTAWVVTSRLMAHTGIRSRGTACGAVKALVTAGWLTAAGAHPSHSQRVVYRLTVPDETATPEPVRTTRTRGDGGRYATKTGPAGGPVQQADRSMDGTRTGPSHGHEPVHPMAATGPADGPDSLYDSLYDSPHDSPRGGSVHLFDSIGATPEEEKILRSRITNGKHIRDLGAYLAAMHRSGDLAAMLAEIRAEIRAEAIAVALKRLRQAQPCRHDCPGGDQPHPGTGQLLCPLCRRYGPAPRPGELPPEGPAGQLAQAVATLAVPAVTILRRAA